MTLKTLSKKTQQNNTILKKDMYYPETDGKPMAETDFQAEYLMYLVQTLRLFFADHDNVYVSGNLLIYYEEGNPKACVAPDVFVVFGVANHKRPIYKVWEEGKGPDVIIEITSKTTRKQDEVTKPKLYQKLGVKEYFQYDPTGDYLNPVLKGRWLDEDGVYQAMGTEKTSSGEINLESRILGLFLEVEDGHLHVYNPKTNTYLPSLAESQRQLAESQHQLTESQHQLTESQHQLEIERNRADNAEAELKALKAQLKSLGIDTNL